MMWKKGNIIPFITRGKHLIIFKRRFQSIYTNMNLSMQNIW